MLKTITHQLIDKEIKMKVEIPKKNSHDCFFEDFWNHCLSSGSKRIGQGTTRDVYDIPGNDLYVLKVCKVPSNQTNWAECVIYNAARENKKYLAKVISISLSGKFLIMERLDTNINTEKLMLKIPEFPKFINDKKPTNFGYAASGELKMLDYSQLDL